MIQPCLCCTGLASSDRQSRSMICPVTKETKAILGSRKVTEWANDLGRQALEPAQVPDPLTLPCSWPALHLRLQLCHPPELPWDSKYVCASCLKSLIKTCVSNFNESLRLLAFCRWLPHPWKRCWPWHCGSKPTCFHLPPKSNHFKKQ